MSLGLTGILKGTDSIEELAETTNVCLMDGVLFVPYDTSGIVLRAESTYIFCLKVSIWVTHVYRAP